MPDQPWPRIRSSTLADQVYEAVRNRILEGDLEPGEFAREQELSEAMGVSRTPVREALGRLASEGFLERIPHHGFRVPTEAMSRVLEIYPIVSALELLAARLAFPRVDGADLDELRSINAELKEAIAAEEIERAIDLDNRFHALIAERSGNRRLLDLIDELKSQIWRLETWYYSSRENAEKSVREHTTLIKALETGKLDLALAIVERNLAGTLVILLEETDEGPAREGLAQAVEAFSSTYAEDPAAD